MYYSGQGRVFIPVYSDVRTQYIIHYIQSVSMREESKRGDRFHPQLSLAMCMCKCKTKKECQRDGGSAVA